MAAASSAPIIDVEIVGLRELRARYDEGSYIVRAVMAERAAALHVSARLAYRLHAPRGKPDKLGRPRKLPPLADSIEADVLMGAASMTLTVRVPPEQANKVEWLRHGTSAHEIRPVTASALHFWWERMGQEVWTQHVSHPGTRPNPWEDDARHVVEALVHEAGLTMGNAVARRLGGV